MICFGCWPLVAKKTCIKGGFQEVPAMFYIVVHSVHVRCLIKCLLGIFSLVWTPMSTKHWGFSCFLMRNMFGSLAVYLTHLAPHVHFPYFGHALHIATFFTHLCYPYHVLVYTLCLHPSLSCLPYALQHLFCLVFDLHFSFILHPSCIILLIHSFISCLLFSLTPLSIRVKKGESILQSSIPESFIISTWILCTSLGGEILFLVHICRGRDIPQGR